MKNRNRDPYPIPSQEDMERMEQEDMELHLHHMFIQDLVKRMDQGLTTDADTFDIIRYTDDIKRYRFLSETIRRIDKENKNGS